jgi:hypothetical protein
MAVIRRSETEHEQTGIVSASLQRSWFGGHDDDDSREPDWWDWWIHPGQHLVDRDGAS